MSQLVEIAWESLNKRGEELCGDWVKIAGTPEERVVVLSDGLGSGVKANILATLTTEIASNMLMGGASIDDVVETLAATLPECQVRHLAYATFAVLRVVRGERAYLAEYDCPPLMLLRAGKIVDLPLAEREIAGHQIREGHFELQNGDYMLMLSDGYIHAGVGGLYRMGWGWQNIATSALRWTATGDDAYELAGALSRTCNKLSNGAPGDDATVIAMRVRPPRMATILTGPPSDPSLDNAAVARLTSAEGTRAICGGTTAQMAARVLGRPLRVEWTAGAARSRASQLPPAATLDGIDLVTEGILTLSSAAECVKKAQRARNLPPDRDPATRLARILLDADEIHFIAGDAINPQQLADVVRGKPMRQIYLDELISELKSLNKQVTVEHL